MRKKRLWVITAMVLITLAKAAYPAQAPNKREWKIYYTYVDKMHSSPNPDSGVFQHKFDEIASANGITPKELSAILMKVDEFGLSLKEKKIFRQLQKKLRALPADATFEQKMEAYKEVGRKYRLSEEMLFDITRRGVLL